jgi:hypothetical protein
VYQTRLLKVNTAFGAHRHKNWFETRARVRYRW